MYCGYDLFPPAPFPQPQQLYSSSFELFFFSPLWLNGKVSAALLKIGQQEAVLRLRRCALKRKQRSQNATMTG